MELMKWRERGGKREEETWQRRAPGERTNFGDVYCSEKADPAHTQKSQRSPGCCVQAQNVTNLFTWRSNFFQCCLLGKLVLS